MWKMSSIAHENVIIAVSLQTGILVQDSISPERIPLLMSETWWSRERGNEICCVTAGHHALGQMQMVFITLHFTEVHAVNFLHSASVRLPDVLSIISFCFYNVLYGDLSAPTSDACNQSINLHSLSLGTHKHHSVYHTFRSPPSGS